MARLVFTPAAKQFDDLADSTLVNIPTACAVTGRSRNSIYRHFAAGELTPIKIGASTRISVGEIRRLIRSVAEKTPM